MDRRFRNIRVLIWDYDGTFYKPNQDLWQDVREAEFRTIMAHTGWNRREHWLNLTNTLNIDSLQLQ